MGQFNQPRAQLPTLPDRPITFASYAEYATGMLLERYIGDYELKMGHTFQVPIGHNKHCDFLVNGVFVEFHPINLRHEFSDRQAARQFGEAMRHVAHPFRERIVNAVKNEFAEKYYERRKFLVSMHGGKDSELIVCQDHIDLYQSVIKRFGVGYPKQANFINEFNALARQRF
jgi:hypothetical protein